MSFYSIALNKLAEAAGGVNEANPSTPSNFYRISTKYCFWRWLQTCEIAALCVYFLLFVFICGQCKCVCGWGGLLHFSTTGMKSWTSGNKKLELVSDMKFHPGILIK